MAFDSSTFRAVAGSVFLWGGVVLGQNAPDGVSLRWRHRVADVARYDSSTTQRAPAPVGSSTLRARLEVTTASVSTDGSAALRVRMSRTSTRGPLARVLRENELDGAMQTVDANVERTSLGAVSTPPSTRGLDGFAQSLADSFELLSPVYADRPVRVGDSWESSRIMRFDLGLGMHLVLRVTTSATLSSVTRTRASTEGRATLGLVMQFDTVESSTVAGAAVLATGRATGESIVELSNGSLVSSTLHGRIQLTVHAAMRDVHSDVRFSQSLIRTDPP